MKIHSVQIGTPMLRYIRIPEGNHVKENIKPITIITTTNKGRIIDLQKYYFI